MSHELRTPLNSILGFTQVLARDPLLNCTQKDHLGIIARSGEHLLALLNDVLEMSKIEAGLIELNTNNFDLYNLLNSLKEMFLLKAKSKNLQLVFDFAANVPQYVQTDESKLRQVLINLVGNAVKFTNQGKVILQVAKLGTNEAIASEEQDGVDSILSFEVSDTGPGIASEELDNLFEAFVQTETGRRSQDGTGLGMPISKRFVQLMGGDIRVESTYGKGTIVNFDIKVQMAKVSDVQPPQVKRRVIALAPNQPKYRILLADDKWESRHLMKNLLAPLEFEIREAENGQEAIALWQSWQPHLIWMDMQMPEMDGYEATQRIRALEQERGQENGRTGGRDDEITCDSDTAHLPFHPPTLLPSHFPTKIIALTANAFVEEQSQILSAGCDGLLSKPFRRRILLDMIQDYLGVQYQYAEATAPPKEIPTARELPASPDTSPLNESAAVHLATMPSAWVKALHLAATRADGRQVMKLIEQIPETSISLKRTLNNWVDNFQFDQIMTFTGGDRS